MAKRVVGVSIESATVKAVELRAHRGRVAVLRAGAVELAPGAVDWGTIVDQAAVVEALRQLWSQAGFTTKRVVLSIDGHQALTRQTQLPVLSEASYREALRYDLAELLTYDADDAVIDHIELSTHLADDGLLHRQAIAIAVNDQALAALREVAASAGLRIVGFDLPALALDRIGTSSAPDGADLDRADQGRVVEPPEGATAADVLVHIESDLTTIVVRSADGVQFFRTVTVGTGDEASALASELESHVQTIFAHERLGGGEHEGTFGQYRHPVSEAVRGTLEFLTTTSPGIAPVRILVSGTESSDVLAELVADGSSLPILEAQPTVRWRAEGSEAAGYLLEAGTALSALSAGERGTLTLETDRQRERASVRSGWRVGVGLALLATMAAGLDIQRRVDAATGAELHAGQAEAALARVEAIAVELASVDETEASYRQATALLDQALADDVDLVGVIDAIVTELPDDAPLLAMTVQADPDDSLVPYDEDLGQPVGAVRIEAKLDGHLDTAAWLRALERVTHLDGERIDGSTGVAGTEGADGSSVIADATVFSTARWDRAPLYRQPGSPGSAALSPDVGGPR